MALSHLGSNFYSTFIRKGYLCFPKFGEISIAFCIGLKVHEMIAVACHHPPHSTMHSENNMKCTILNYRQRNKHKDSYEPHLSQACKHCPCLHKAFPPSFSSTSIWYCLFVSHHSVHTFPFSNVFLHFFL